MSKAGKLASILEALRSLPEMVEVEGVKSVVVFGSATRPGDFVWGLSDVDVLAVTSGKPARRRRSLYLLGARVDITFLTVHEVVETAERGDPLAFMLKAGAVVLDDGTFASLRIEPKVTSHTLRVLRMSALAALGLAIECYFLRDYRRAAHHAYHALRHLVRYFASEVGSPRIPLSDEEIARASGELRELFLELRELRRREPEELEALSALERTFKAVATKLGLEGPALAQVVRHFSGEDVAGANVCEEEGQLVIKVSVLAESGYRTYKVSKSGIEPADTLLC